VIAKEFGSKAQIPSIDHHTPNAATIDFTSASGKKLHIDILTGVLDLNSDDVRKLAVSLQIDSNKPIPVLHPLLVLATPERHREAFKASKRIANIAQSSAGVFVWKE
jgi:hypothetical protein